MPWKKRGNNGKLSFHKGDVTVKILITGGAGYIGSKMVELFRTRHSLTVLDKLLYTNEYLRTDVDFIYGDVADEKFMASILPKFDAVVNLAAIVGDRACAMRMTDTANANLTAVKILSQNFDGRILHMSTCSVYGKQEGILTEESSTNPLSWYAETKLYAEEHLKNNNAVILRLGTLHGLSQRLRFDLVVNTLIIHALMKGTISIFGGNQWRPLLQVHDLVNCFDELLHHDATGIYNLKEENRTIKDVAEEIIKQIPDVKLTEHDIKFQDSRNYQVSATKFEDTFISRMTLGVKTTLYEIQKLFTERRVKNYSSPAYSNVAQLTVIE